MRGHQSVANATTKIKAGTATFGESLPTASDGTTGPPQTQARDFARAMLVLLRRNTPHQPPPQRYSFGVRPGAVAP
jgi:hypothetical protein